MKLLKGAQRIVKGSSKDCITLEKEAKGKTAEKKVRKKFQSEKKWKLRNKLKKEKSMNKALFSLHNNSIKEYTNRVVF
jgi:hypothetical protein